MKKIPRFIKEFSIQHSMEEREETFSGAQERRKKTRGRLIESSQKLEKLRWQEKERSEKLAEIMSRINTLQGTLENFNSSTLRKIINFFRIKETQNKISGLFNNRVEIEKEQVNERISIEELERQTTNTRETQDVRQMLNDFYEEQVNKWKNEPYSKEELEKHFSEKHLASLSLEDYILLLRRFPNELVTHVTRQGIRDHTGHMFHSSGEGDYNSGFMDILGDGKLRSPLGVYLIEENKENAVAKFLKLDDFENKEEALEYLEKITRESQGQGSYADSEAVHFATEEVADIYYGSEKGNEIFITYPSAFIASQYHFSGILTEASGNWWNDVWVWTSEKKGIDINAGLVFIPADAQVDRNTGSRYELDELNRAIVNQEYLDKAKAVVDSNDFGDFAESVTKISRGIRIPHDKWTSMSQDDKNWELLRDLEPFRKKLEKDFEIKDVRLQNVLLNFGNLKNFALYKEKEGTKVADEPRIVSEIRDALKNLGIYYKEARDTISSQEFWGEYFTQHPEQKPSKIIYYEGGDPTEAMNGFRRENRLTKRSRAEHDLGFPEKHISSDSKIATAGMDRFKNLALKIIEKHFTKTV